MITLQSSKPKEFWRKEDPVLDENRRVLKGGMWQHQREWWALPNFVKVLVAGLGSGKTLIGAKRIISLALQNAPYLVSAVSPTFPMARRTVIPTIQALLAGKHTIYGRKFWSNFNKSIHEFQIRFRGRSATIIVQSGEEPKLLKGSTLAAAWIDEPFIQKREVFDEMTARVRHPQARHREIAITGTSEGLNWGYDICLGEVAARLNVGVVHASTRSNRALDPGYVNRLESTYSARAATAYIEGQFVNLSEGLVFYAFDPAENVVELPTPEHAELGVGMDFNVQPMAASCFWRMGERIHYFDEIELPNSDTPDMCGELRQRFGSRLSDVYPDASGASRHSNSGKSDFQAIRERGFRINARAANPERRDRFNAANGKLKPKTGAVALTISPKCTRLIRYLMSYSHELLNRPEQKAMSHLLDAFSYPLAYLYPVDRQAVTVTKLRGF